MNNMLFGSMGFSACSLFFASFTLAMYLNKKRYKDLENTLFFALLLLVFVLIFFEFGYIYYLHKGDTGTMANILCRGWLNGLIIWMIGFTYYIIVTITRKINDLSRRNKLRKNIGIIFIVVCIISLTISNLLPIEFYDSSYHIYSFSGDAAIIGFALAGCTLLTMVYAYVIRKDMVTSVQRKPIIFTISSIGIVTLLQFLFPQIDHNFQNFESVMLLITLFFTLESQDNKLLEEHEKSKDEADKSNAEQTEFLTSMSHEIRTPMSVIMGYSEVILRERSNDYGIVKKDLDNIHFAAEGLLELINNILDLSKIDSGKELLIQNDFEIKNLIIELNDLINSRIDDNKVKYTINVDENLPSIYNGDVAKLKKILSNLLINTIYYTNEGSINFEIKQVVDDSKNLLHFGIHTKGGYINPDIVSKYLSDEKSVDITNNALLSMNLAKIYSNIMEGNISFESDKGSNFSYIFEYSPLIMDSKPIGNINSLFTKDDVKLNLENKNILVVDDNNLNIKLFVKMLNEYHANIDSANSGMECIEMIGNKKYDAVFLDHMMPEMDGIETIHKLEDLKGDLPPIIALTANANTGDREYYLSEGFSEYLVKPINRMELNNLLEKIFLNK